MSVYTLNVRDESDGTIWAEIEELPGCFISGADEDELMEAATEAISLYLAKSPEPQTASNVVPLCDCRRLRPR